MIDMHSHIEKKQGEYQIEALLADMNRFHIDQRVISNLRVDQIQEGIQEIADIVSVHPDRLIGCAVLNPSVSTILEDAALACSLPEIKVIEFQPYLHGYAPDDCPILDQVFQLISKRKLIVKVFSGIGAKAMPHQWEIYTRRYPELSFLYLHMGCFDYGYSCVDIVKRHANAYIETSNQYELQILRKAFQQLPTEKILFGSSYPERFTRNAIEIFDLFDLSPEIRAAFMADNAQTLLKENGYDCD